MRFRSEIWKVKSAVEKIFDPHCYSSFFPPRFHLLNYLLNCSERFVSLQFMNVGPVEHFNLLIRRSYGTTLRRLSTRMHETVQDMRSAPNSMQKPESGIHENVVGTSVLRKRKNAESVEGTRCVMRCACDLDKFPKKSKEQKQLFQLNARLLKWVRCSVRSGRRHL